MRSSDDRSSGDPHARSDTQVKVELWGGWCWGEAVKDAGRVIIHITIQKGIAVKEKRLE